MRIKTNHVPRPVLDASELSIAERAEFDYLDWSALEDGSDSASFIRFKGEVYDLGEFMVWDNPSSPTRHGWDGYRSDSYFSGLVVRYLFDDDHGYGEMVIVGTYFA